MQIHHSILFLTCLLLPTFLISQSEEPQKDDNLKIEQSGLFLEPGVIRKLTTKVKPSIVSVTQIGRDNTNRGLGSGFVIDGKEGLIATNFHVIGEGRPVTVELSDGTTFEVEEIRASDQYFDLAILKIDPKGHPLTALELGDSSKLDQGNLIVGFGSPLGLKFSVVAGVISAIRKLEDNFFSGESPAYPMIQVAMPVEVGNSGGPIVDLDGKVMGIVTAKHRLKDDLGFAVPINDLKPLIKEPNPIPMSRWKTIGTLDPRQWDIVMDGDWTQRSGAIYAKNPGKGFGGRTLCLSKNAPPEGDFDLSVKVKLNKETGAAGLVFSADGGDTHFGFYPSSGQIRLTKFKGPDVYSWDILQQIQTAAYKPGEWNHLRVRLQGKFIIGFVNDEKIFSIKDSGLKGTQVGLCKFRQTEAEFRDFKMGENLDPISLSEQQADRLNQLIEVFLKEKDQSPLLAELEGKESKGRDFLEVKAKEFEAKAKEMRALKQLMHQQAVQRDLAAALKAPEVDLFEVALQIARIDDPELNEDHYRSVYSRLVTDAKTYIGKTKSDLASARKLRDFLFKENGFHGSRNEYYHHANSYINHVLDDREGLPITLSILFIEMARRLEIKGAFGAALPGQFQVGFRSKSDDEVRLFNVFDNGEELTRAQAVEISISLGSQPSIAAAKSNFQPAKPQDIAARMIHNLIGIELNQNQNPPAALGYLDLLISILPDDSQARFQRSLVRLETKDVDGAKRDLDWLLEKRPPGLNYQRLERFRAQLP